MARMGAAPAWTTWLALILGAGCGSSGQDPGAPLPGAGEGGAGGAGSSSTTGAASTTGAGGGGSAFACDPPAEPGSLYELSAVSYDLDAIDPVSMCKYRGEVMLIVNTAAL